MTNRAPLHPVAVPTCRGTGLSYNEAARQEDRECCGLFNPDETMNQFVAALCLLGVSCLGAVVARADTPAVRLVLMHLKHI